MTIEAIHPQADWIRCERLLPPIGMVVETKIDDERGVRNERRLKRGGKNGRLWFLPYGDFYVYYEPNFWRSIQP
jgi:hypothetical protein